MKARTKIAAIALVAGFTVLSVAAMAQSKCQRIWKSQPPMAERTIVKPDTSLFGVNVLMGKGDTSSALIQQARVGELAKALSNCRTGEEFCKAALVAQRAFYKGRDATFGSLEYAIRTGKYDCRTLSAETWFDVAVRLGFDAKVVFVEDHVLLEVNGHCLEANKNQQYPSSELSRRYKNLVYLKTADKKAIMAIEYVRMGAKAWNRSDTVNAIMYAKMAVECAPTLPEPHYNLSIYLENVNLNASKEEHNIYLRLLPGMPAAKISASN